MTKLILASKSPRRAELLGRMGFSFEIAEAKVDESAISESILIRNLGMGGAQPGLNPMGAGPLGVPNIQNAVPLMYRTAEEIVQALALAKASAIYKPLQETDAEGNKDVVVIGSDTIVVCTQQILGKPKDAEDAKEMLITLSGQTHRVYTGVTVLSQDGAETFVSYADVTFHELDQTQEMLIDRYVAGGSPMDKAGAYGIQDEGALLIDSISGDYYAVVGLPISRLYHVLSRKVVC